jgi:hypothetical protein
MTSKKYLFSVMLLFVTALFISAQDCKLYFPDKPGAIREITSYDKKDKQTGRAIQEIISKDVNGKNVSLRVKTSLYGEDNAEVGVMEMDILCEDGVFKVDMSNYMSAMMAAYKDMEVEMTGDNLVFPTNLKPGDVLPDGSMNMIVRTGGMQIMNMTVNITNRKVEAAEKITTKAGTFDCFKITYDSQAKTKIMNIQTSAVEWIAEGVGIVKTETYDKKGKIESYQVLTKLER